MRLTVNRLRKGAIGLALAWLMLACASGALMSIDALMKQGLAQYEAGEFDASVLSFERVIEREPTRVLAYVYIARSLLAQARFAPAIDSARKALELAPDDPEVVSTLVRGLLEGGRDALRSGEFATAIGYLTEYVAREPAALDGYVDLARSYLGSSDPVAAGKVLLNGLASAEGDLAPLLPLLLESGKSALSAGDTQAAIEQLSTYAERQAQDPAGFVELAKAFLKDGSLMQALSAARKAMQLDPSDAGAASLLQNLLNP